MTAVMFEVAGRVAAWAAGQTRISAAAKAPMQAEGSFMREMGWEIDCTESKTLQRPKN